MGDTKEIKFLSQNNSKLMQKRRSKSFSLSEFPFEIDESVIEYHVPSIVQKLNKRRNKNIKINIHINNDIIGGAKQKKNKKKHEKSLSFMSDKSGSEVQMSKSSSVASPSKRRRNTSINDIDQRRRIVRVRSMAIATKRQKNYRRWIVHIRRIISRLVVERRLKKPRKKKRKKREKRKRRIS